MLRTLELKFKHLLSLFLRASVGSRRLPISPQSTFRRILVIRQHNQLGDMLCIVPLLRALREKYPAAYIALMASPVNYDVMLNNRYVDSVINYDKREFLGKGWKGWKSLVSFVRGLRRSKFDLAIVPSTVSTSFTSDMLAYLSGASHRVGVESLDGKPNPSGFFHNMPIALDWRPTPHRHQTLRNLDVGGGMNLSTSNLAIEMTLDKDETDRVNRLKQNKLEQVNRFIVYHPGAGKPANRWDAARFANTANAIAADFNVSTFVTHGPMDDEPVQEMVRHLVTPYEIIRGKSIREVAIILATMDLLITNDTGIMHVAAAMGTPTLSLFGPTDAEQWAPIGARNRMIQAREGNINLITVDEVLQAAREMLKPD